MTVPPGVSRMAVILSIFGTQVGAGGTYFDDLEVRKISEEGG